MRIVSLLPSATEIVCALGLRDSLVGVSHECDFPAGVRGLPALTEARIDPSRSSAAIDASVRELVRDGLSVYRIDSERLAELAPDVIVTQEHCDVCAVSYHEVVEATRELLGSACTIVSLNPVRLEDVFADIVRVAAATEAAAAGAAVVASMRERIDRLRQLSPRARYRPRVVCLEWLDPLMTAGNWMPELIELCGASDAASVSPGEHSPTIDWPSLVASRPEVLVLMPCGFELGQTLAELPGLKQRPEWSELAAVRNQRVYAVDGNAYFNRPGPRLADSAELLAGLLQPSLFAPSMPADAWAAV